MHLLDVNESRNLSTVTGESVQEYSCKSCNERYAMNFFSKTQINKLLHKKIQESQLICKACVSILEKGDAKRSLEKIAKQEEHKKNEISIRIQQEEKTLALQAAKLKKKQQIEKDKLLAAIAERSKSDPSLQYFQHPTNIPIVKEAKQYFHQLNNPLSNSRIEYAVHLNKECLQGGWRTVAKLAVRHNFDYDDADGNSISKEKKKRVLIGLFAPNSHDILPNCLSHPSHHPAINEVVQLIDFVCNDSESNSNNNKNDDNNNSLLVTGFKEKSRVSSSSSSSFSSAGDSNSDGDVGEGDDEMNSNSNLNNINKLNKKKRKRIFSEKGEENKHATRTRIIDIYIIECRNQYQ